MLDIERLMIAAQVAKNILAERVVTLLTLIMTFSLFAWAMSYPSNIAYVIAVSFAVIVFLPVLIGGRKAQAPPEVNDNGKSD